MNLLCGCKYNISCHNVNFVFTPTQWIQHIQHGNAILLPLPIYVCLPSSICLFIKKVCHILLSLPTLCVCPNMVFSAPLLEQFHRLFRNWYWHSLIPSWTPSPIVTIAFGLFRQMDRCRGVRPGILLQMKLARRATTDDNALLRRRKRD